MCVCVCVCVCFVYVCMRSCLNVHPNNPRRTVMHIDRTFGWSALPIRTGDGEATEDSTAVECAACKRDLDSGIVHVQANCDAHKEIRCRGCAAKFSRKNDGNNRM